MQSIDASLTLQPLTVLSTSNVTSRETPESEDPLPWSGSMPSLPSHQDHQVRIITHQWTQRDRNSRILNAASPHEERRSCHDHSVLEIVTSSFCSSGARIHSLAPSDPPIVCDIIPTASFLHLAALLPVDCRERSRFRGAEFCCQRFLCLTDLKFKVMYLLVIISELIARWKSERVHLMFMSVLHLGI